MLQDAWWNYSYSPAFDDAGDVVGVLVVATETTKEVAARSALEAAKREAEVARQELEALFLQAPMPIAFMKGDDHRFVFVNDRLYRVDWFGCAATPALGELRLEGFGTLRALPGGAR